MTATPTRFDPVRYAAMIEPQPGETEHDMLGLLDIPGHLGNLYKADSLHTFRSNARDNGGHGPVALPKPDKVIPRGGNHGRPLWWRRTIDKWALQTGRRDPITLEPQRPRHPGAGPGKQTT